MAEELQVVVSQEVGEIKWNFEELKTALAAKMKEYEGLVYTEETVPTAKADVAALRKLKKSVSDKRIEIKKKCLEPYELIEAQAQELTDLLDKPIEQIAAQLDEYETMRREAVKSQILAYMEEAFVPAFPADIATRLRFKVYDAKWENASTAKKTWKQAIDDAVKSTKEELALLDGIEEEFKEAATRTYATNLSITEAMTRVTEMRQQKEIILERERERIAREERAKAEAEARAKIEAERKAAEVPLEEKPQTTPPRVLEQPKFASEDGGAKIHQPRDESALKCARRALDSNGAEIHVLRIRATEEQIVKIKGYIEYCGAVYREEA